jgi:hypothetical protein
VQTVKQNESEDVRKQNNKEETPLPQLGRTIEPKLVVWKAAMSNGANTMKITNSRFQ